jgi:putative flippase GtrA
MPPARSWSVALLIEEHGSKALRYCGVSVVNVVTGLGTLTFCLAVLDMSPVTANVVAWLVSTGPAYLLSRYWVWQQTGANSVKSEIVPFWILAFVGLAASTVAVGVAGAYTDKTVIIVAVNLITYGFVWVAKYLVLDNVMWGNRSGDKADVDSPAGVA